MASFRVTSSEPTPSLQPSDDTVLQKVWTISSAKQIETLELHIPGVAFIDLASSPVTLTAPEDAVDQVPPAVEGKIVAQIVVTSDSVELLESLEVIPLSVDKEDQGFRFRVKNEDAELRGSILTEVFVSDKHALKEFSGGTATYVLGDSILVENDPTTDINLWAFQSASLFVSSAHGFTLRSLRVSIVGDGAGTLQLQAPFIKAQNSVRLMAVWGASTLAVSAAEITAKHVDLSAISQGDVIVHAPHLNAKSLSSMVGFSGSVNFVGDGHAKLHQAMIMKNGKINTGSIIADKADALIGWSGRILLSAVDELNVVSPFFGKVEYANLTSPPAMISDTSLLWWKGKKTPGTMAKPAATDSSSLAQAKSYTFREPPLRQPLAVHQHVVKSRDNVPQIVDPDERSWTARHSKLSWGIVTAVGAVVIIVTKRRATLRA